MTRRRAHSDLAIGKPVRRFIEGFGAIAPKQAYVHGVVTACEGTCWRVLWETGAVERHAYWSVVRLLASEPRNFGDQDFLRFLV
jgi:hypothetical protein